MSKGIAELGNHPDPVFLPQEERVRTSEMINEFKQRLSFDFQKAKKWASRNRITCYRVYDKEVPGFPLTIDVYEDRLCVSEFLTGAPPPEDSARDGLLEALESSLGFPRAKIHFKTREKQQGKSQYERFDEKEEFFVIREGGLKFLANLTDYLDTGLFLDHRWTRSFVRDASAGMKVLNLFAYTGSFTVYAVHGGAFETTTVDLNVNYLAWAEKNLALNALAGPSHRFFRRDVLEFLRSETRKFYDVIVLDPPTFSNSKKMDSDLDVQRDHAWLIRRCLAILNPGGLLFFSNNLRSFKLDKDGLPPCKVRDITALTLPKDFRKGAHKAFLITHLKGPEITLRSPEADL